MFIDAHQHYWDPARGDYGWMPPNDPILTRPYGPADLAPTLAQLDIHATVLVQAAPTVAETKYLLGLAKDTPSIAAVVGWIDFESASDRAALDRLSTSPHFRGIRPMIQDLDDGWMLRPDVQWAFAAACDMDLTFDALGFPRHLIDFDTICGRYPNLRIVVDHCMKPQISTFDDTAFQDWAAGVTRLAQYPQVFCKLSGLVTEADPGVTTELLRPFADHVISAFGPNRVMWGSDWPVVRLRCTYADWFHQARALTSHLSTAKQEEVFAGSAQRFYRPKIPAGQTRQS